MAVSTQEVTLFCFCNKLFVTLTELSLVESECLLAGVPVMEAECFNTLLVTTPNTFTTKVVHKPTLKHTPAFTDLFSPTFHAPVTTSVSTLEVVGQAVFLAFSINHGVRARSRTAIP